MNLASVVLGGVVAAVWGVVYLVTQTVTDPPLGVGTTILIGVVLTVVLIAGYNSALRGPRMPRGRRGGDRQDGTIAALGRSAPLRSGLTEQAALRTAELLYPLLGGDAVAITDRTRVLAFLGPGSDHHTVGDPPQTLSSAKVFAKARTVVFRDRSGIGCPNSDCPLQTAVASPLMIGDRVVGALKVYRLDSIPPNRDAVEALGGILSLHLELAELDRERQLAVDAKLDALRAQINPHFLFNTLNTIASKARTDPEEARQLLLRLSDFFRYAARQDGQFAEFGQEYFFVRSYLALEQARYGDRLRVRFDIDPQVLTVQVPVLTIQPLVENAVKHGLANKVEGGTVSLKARVDPLTRTTTVRVADDGVGIDDAVVRQITTGEGAGSGGGIGLRNISERLATLFGERFGLDITAPRDGGTVVEVRFPLR